MLLWFYGYLAILEIIPQVTLDGEIFLYTSFRNVFKG